MLDHLANEMGLPTLLGKYTKEILSRVYAHCTDFKSINHRPDWFQRTDLDLNHVIENNCLKALNSLEAMDSTALQKSIFENTCKNTKLMTKAYSTM